jgi:protein-tyrosine phosphatase
MAGMNSFIYGIIPGELAGMPMPFVHPERRLRMGGRLDEFDDELRELHAAGIRAVVTLLDIPSDEALFERAGFDFLCLPVPDGKAPTIEQVIQFVQFVDERRTARSAVAVHCEAGLGRTGTLLAAYLIAKGDTPSDAIARLRGIEPAAIESGEQSGEQMRFLQELPGKIQGAKR